MGNVGEVRTLTLGFDRHAAVHLDGAVVEDHAAPQLEHELLPVVLDLPTLRQLRPGSPAEVAS